MTKLAFNAAALAGTLAVSKVRVRVADMGHYQELQIRPTERASSVNVPKGEVLVDIENGQVAIPEDMAPGIIEGQFLVLQDRKHGWICLCNAVPVGNAPGAEVKA